MDCNICYILSISYITRVSWDETMTKGLTTGWLIFFYSVPSKPVSNRMKVWRKLMKAGAVQLKGAVYILPLNDEHSEFLQWLVSEIASMKGDGAFVSVKTIETIRDEEIIPLFNLQRDKDLVPVAHALDNLETKVTSLKKGSKVHGIKALRENLNKLRKEFDDIQRIDFFSSATGKSLKKRITGISAELKKISGEAPREEVPSKAIPLRRVEDYQGRVWVTRKKPYVDRMASAWLIRRFIDKRAVFQYTEEKDLRDLGKNYVVFDMQGGEFTHVGDICTFEVLIKSFGLKDRALKRIAEIVHELDIRDDRFHPGEAKGVEEILFGIRRTVRSDAMLLEKGMEVFEMLYASKS